jgi:hypothetical protein
MENKFERWRRPSSIESKLCGETLDNLIEIGWPPLWSSGQSSWLQIQRSGFDSRRYQIFLEVLGLERGPLSLVGTTEKLLERKSSGSCLEIGEYSHGDPLRWPRRTLYPQKRALTSPTSGCRSLGIVRSRTKATELFIFEISFPPNFLFVCYTGWGRKFCHWLERTSIAGKIFHVVQNEIIKN